MPLRVVLMLLRARARHAGPRWLIVALGLAVAVVVPVLTQAVATVTAAEALREGIAALPAGERSVIVSYNGILDPAELTRFDTLVAGALPRIASPPVRRQMLFRQIADTQGGAFVLGAADGLDRAVRLVTGRLPTSCTPQRCEVVTLEIAGAPAPAPPASLGLVVVGTVARVDPLLLTGTFDPGPAVPVLLADGVAKVAALASLGSFGRSFGWVAPLDADRVRAMGVEGWVREGAVVADDLWRDGEGLVVTAPDDALRAQDRRARVSASRFSLLGGASGVLLLGTAVVGAAALRRDHEAFLGALRRRGASRRGLIRLLIAESTLAALVATGLGLLIGAAVAAALAARAGLPVAVTAAGAVTAALPSACGLAAASAVLLGVTLGLRPAGGSGSASAKGAWRAVDGVALACAVTAALLMARGGVGATTAGVAGTRDPLLPVLPVLVLVAAALALARVWPAVVRLAQRAVPRRAVGARLGLTAAAGRPLRPVATAALLTAAVAAAVFAGSYRATLDRGAADQAAYAVPMDALLTVGRSLQRPQDAVPPQVLAAAAGANGAAGVFPVVRTTASLRVTAESAEPVQVVGLAPSALTRVQRWSAVTGAGDPAALARAITVPSPAPGTALPDGSTGRVLRIATPATVLDVAATAYLRSADGRERGVPLAVVRPPAGSSDGALTATLPDLGAPLHLTAIALRLPSDAADRRQHALGEGANDLAHPTGRVVLGAVSVAGAAVPAPWTGWAATGLAPSADGSTATVSYDLGTGVYVLQGRPVGPGSGAQALPVLTDPATAATAGTGGRLTLTLDRGPILVQVVGVLAQFPTTEGRFVVADGEATARLIDQASPGTGQATQVWLDAATNTAGDTAGETGGEPADLAATLAQAPFDKLAVQQRAAVESALRADPVARAASGLLAATAALVVLVAALALVLLVVSERVDDAASAYAWEADGVAPATLRAALWWRAVAVAVPAVPVGVLTGGLLSLLTARLVAVTAGATTPHPPLVAGTGLGTGLVAVLIGTVLALGVAALVAARSLREPLPVRGIGALR